MNRTAQEREAADREIEQRMNALGITSRDQYNARVTEHGVQEVGTMTDAQLEAIIEAEDAYYRMARTRIAEGPLVEEIRSERGATIHSVEWRDEGDMVVATWIDDEGNERREIFEFLVDL